MKPSTVIAMLEAKTGKENELKNALLEIIEPSRANSGCLTFRVHQNKNNPAHFILYEIWKDDAAHLQHANSSYIQNLTPKLEDLLAKPYQVFFVEEV